MIRGPRRRGAGWGAGLTGRPLRLAALIVVAALFGAAPVPVLAQGTAAVSVALPDGRTVTPTTNAETLQLVQFLIANGDTDTAARLIRAWQPGHPDHAVRVAYVDGLIAQARGDDPEAVRLYRGILAQRPELDIVRVQLAGALARLGLVDGARDQAERLIAAGVDDRLGGQMQGLIRSLDSRRSFRFRGYFSFLPSTNVNNGTNQTTARFGPFVGAIPRAQQRQSGVGVLLGGQLSGRWQLDPRHAAVAALDVSAERFPSIDRTNLSGGLSLGVERRVSRGLLLGRAIVGGAAVDGTRTYRYTGLAAEANLRLNARWRLNLAPEYRYERFDAVPGDEGHYVDIPVQLDRFAGPDRFTRFIAGASFGRKEQARFSFDEVRLGLGHYREFAGGVTLYGQAVAARRAYHGNYPGLGEPQTDRRLELSATLTKRDFEIGGFAPQVTLRRTRTQSNAAFADITKNDVEIRLVREF